MILESIEWGRDWFMSPLSLEPGGLVYNAEQGGTPDFLVKLRYDTRIVGVQGTKQFVGIIVRDF